MENSTAVQNSTAKEMCNYISECMESSKAVHQSIAEILDNIVNKMQESEEQNAIHESIKVLDKKLIERGNIIVIIPGSDPNDEQISAKISELLKDIGSVNVVSNLMMLTNVQEDYTDAQIPDEIGEIEEVDEEKSLP